MEPRVRLLVEGTEIPDHSSVGFGTGVAPDGSALRFYDHWAAIRELQHELDQGAFPEVSVPFDHLILKRRHWAGLG
jgi:hypothetical protein